MEAYRKGIIDSHELAVYSSIEESFPYFLRSCPTVGYPKQLDFRWLKKGKVKASITFAISERAEAISLPQSPFGGIFVEISLSSAELEKFVKAVVEELRRRQISLVKIVQPPKPYESGFDLINYLLYKNGFAQESVLSHQFFIGKKKIKKLAKKEQSKFQTKAKEMGAKVQAGPIQNFGFLQEIRAWNREKGFDANFDDKRLIAHVSEYPERYFLISVLKEDKAVAHTLAVQLTPDSFYYFLSAIQPRCALKNVGELCLFQLFQLAAEHNSNFIDLGSSDTDAGANHSLIFFKSRFSNDVCNKISWSLML
ncbi:hypothetical protein J0A67_00475 [Algoriphagus aestuariicola]|uniref:Acetyltransferase (GNAT) domain-containing protein n=1 Tax=Algoriphagus aestuariicola TaxID=1852016 RepID=A0ABS3BKF7_9BACT|nr:hypothetical protein [Algoriphagus aestuariicola]MBN7799309.1 hypothetical protein [Algoriphagus aestuariicola]